MLGIKIFDEFLDIPAGTMMEIQRDNPYLGTDEIPAEVSFPVSVKYTDKNYRLFSYAGNFYKVNGKLNIDAELYDNGNYKYSGKLIIKKHSTSLNDISKTIWEVVFTANSGDFYQGIKYKKLHQISLGGDNSYPWTTWDPTDGSGGFWQHIHSARTPNSFPYTFFPIYNPSWVDEESRKFKYTIYLADRAYYDDWINRTDEDGNFYSTDWLFCKNMYSLVPMIYVSFIIEKIMEEAGWQMKGSILTDPGYQRLVMVGIRGINWIKRKKNSFDEFITKDPVVFNLKDFVPEGIELQSFLINLKNRFGWKFSFDSRNKIVTIDSLQNTINATAKDWTKYVLSNYVAEYEEKSITYSLINTIDGNDLYPIVADINKVNLISPVNDMASLPDPATIPEGNVCYVFQQNCYYIVQWNNDTEVYEWVIFSHNIGDLLIDGAQKTIESNISTMPTVVLKTPDTTNDGLYPISDYQGNHENLNYPYVNLGIRLLFYHGMHTNSAGDSYPYGSCHSSNFAGLNNLTPWSIPYKREYGSINNGTYDYWFKNWLNFVAKDDVRTFYFNLPVYELAGFTWDDRIRINNAEFIVVSYKEVLPSSGLLEFKMKRIY